MQRSRRCIYPQIAPLQRALHLKFATENNTEHPRNPRTYTKRIATQKSSCVYALMSLKIVNVRSCNWGLFWFGYCYLQDDFKCEECGILSAYLVERFHSSPEFSQYILGFSHSNLRKNTSIIEGVYPDCTWIGTMVPRLRDSRVLASSDRGGAFNAT